MEKHQKALEILGVGNNSSLEEIRHAYRALVRLWHPDRYSDDPTLQQKAQERLKEINEAYRLARRSLAARATEEAPDSPFRFTHASATPLHATASHRPSSPPETSAPSAKQAASRISAAKQFPFGLNVLLLLLVLLCGWVSHAKYGFALQSFTYFLQVMIVPFVCAFVCNTSYGESQRLRIGYFSALLIFGAVIALDAVTLKRQSPEAVYTTTEGELETGRFPRGTAGRDTAVHPPMGPSERPSNKGPQAPSSPDAPTAPLTPSPTQPAQPAAPRAGM